ncbi:hypothetical protein EI555_010254, partial [Monodon monoceros]
QEAHERFIWHRSGEAAVVSPCANCLRKSRDARMKEWNPNGGVIAHLRIKATPDTYHPVRVWARKTPTAQAASKAQQGPDTQQERTAQQRPSRSRSPLKLNPSRNLKHSKNLLCSRNFLPHRSLHHSSHLPSKGKQEAASQHRPGPGKDSRAQQEPELREGAGAQPGPGPLHKKLDQHLWPSLDPDPQKDHQPRLNLHPKRDGDSQTPSPARSSSPGSQIPTRVFEPVEISIKTKPTVIQRPTAEQKTFLERVVDSGADSDLGFTLETNSPAQRGGTVAQGMKLVFKGKPGYEVMSGFGGTSLPSKKTSSQNPRHYWNP